MNKRGFSMIELVATLAVFALVMLLLGMANQFLIQDKQMSDDMYESTSTYDYIVRALVEDIKSSDGTFQVESDIFRAYRTDGTYNEIRYNLGSVYRNGEKVCDAEYVLFQDVGNAIQVDMRFDIMPELHLTLYKPQPGFDG